MGTFTIIDGGVATETAASNRDGAVFVPAAALGWEVKPEGLCRDEICIPVGGRPGLVEGQDVDLERFAALLDRPVAVLDLDENAACIGLAGGEQRRLSQSLEAPDFTLPDLSGKPHSLSAYRGSKVLLVAWASW